MGKSSTLIFVLIFAFIFRLEVFSLRLLGVILLIFFGVFMMVATEDEGTPPAEPSSDHRLLGFLLIIGASAVAGLRWALTHMLLKNKEMGMDNPVSTLFWLAPVMGVTLALLSLIVDSWLEIFTSKFFDGVAQTFVTSLALILPGTVAFSMNVCEFK